MRLTPPEPDFVPGSVGFDGKDANGRKYDLIGRKVLGERLSELVERFDQPLVIALDDDWGSGKSHFLKLWTGAHGLENGGSAKIIYFDAFQHDYLNDPMISLIGAVIGASAEQLAQGGEVPFKDRAIERLKALAWKLAKPAARIGMALATTGLSEVVGPAIAGALAAAKDEVNTAVDSFWASEDDRRAAVAQFKAALQDLTADKSKLVFIVDELDRCRPDYALSLLETIKHFFTVEKVHFVLGVNLPALEQSVKARYGAEIDASQYLQKFIHLKVKLPDAPGLKPGQTTSLTYFGVISEEMGLSEDRIEWLKDFLKRIALRRSPSLRDVQRITSHAALLPAEFEKLNSGMILLVQGALFMKVLSPPLYRNLRASTLNFDDAIRFLAIEPPQANDEYSWDAMIWNDWARALSAQPTEAVMQYTQDEFQNPDTDVRQELPGWLDAYLETFTVPKQPN